MTTCILCKCSMAFHSTKPTWVFDLEKGKLLGEAHATCVRKSNLPHDSSKRVDGPAPTEAQIKFAVQLYKFRKEMRRQPCPSVEWYAYLLTSNAMYRTSNVDELLSSPRVRELLDWWQDGCRIISAEKCMHAVGLLRTELEASK